MASAPAGTPHSDSGSPRIGTLEADEAERDQLRVIMECRAAGFTWEGTDRELARIGYVTRSGPPCTWNNVRFACSTASRIGTV